MDWLPRITIFDALVVVLCLGFLARGIWVGFIRQISFFLALILGFYLTGQFHSEFYKLALPFLDNPQVVFFGTYVILFVVIYFSVMLIGLGLRKVMNITFLGWFDRTLGGLFGLAKGVFLACLLFDPEQFFIRQQQFLAKRGLLSGLVRNFPVFPGLDPGSGTAR